MKIIFVLSILCLTYSSHLFANNPQVKELSLFSKTLKKQISFEITLPENYSEDKTTPYPLFVSTAGQSRLEVVQANVQWLSHVDFGPMPKVIFLPIMNIQGINSLKEAKGGELSKPQQIAALLHNDIYPYLKKHFNVAPFKVVEGFSTHGNLALFLFVNYPDYYQGGIISSPAFELESPHWFESIKRVFIKDRTSRTLILSLGSFKANQNYFEQLQVSHKNPNHFYFEDNSKHNYLTGPLMTLRQGIERIFSDLHILDFTGYEHDGVAKVLNYHQALTQKYGYALSPNNNLHSLAHHLFEQSFPFEANKVFNYLINNNPNNAIYPLRFGQALLKYNFKQEAKTQLEDALQIAKKQNNDEAQSYIANLLQSQFH